MATGYEKYVNRVGHTTKKMSKTLPKPNVCRIEVLDGAARREYMGGFHQALDLFREQMIDAIAEDSKYDIYEPFYGILNAENGNGPSFSVQATWQQPSGTKSGFARMNTILTGGGGNGGLLGITANLPFIGNKMGKLNTGVSNVLNTVEAVAQTGMELSGVNNSCTGSMTIKKFGGATINASLPLKFRWYLPEQEDMCRQSLKRLVMMTYVRPMNMEGSKIVNEMINGLLNAGGKMLDDAKSALSSVVTPTGAQQANTPADAQTYKDGSSTASNSGDTGKSWLRTTGESLLGAGVDAYNSINSYFGGEITANPLPVRVSIGHYLDLEPMVIESVKFMASNEQFISKDGTHLPIFITAEVQVSYWMQPGPTKDFISILGNEVFGQFVNYPSQNGVVGQNKKDGNIGKNNNPNNQKKR